MAELLVLSLLRADAVAADRAARKGDQAMVAWFEGLFEPYRTKELACFLCVFPSHQKDADRAFQWELGPCGPLLCRGGEYLSAAANLARHKSAARLWQRRVSVTAQRRDRRHPSADKRLIMREGHIL